MGRSPWNDAGPPAPVARSRPPALRPGPATSSLAHGGVVGRGHGGVGAVDMPAYVLSLHVHVRFSKGIHRQPARLIPEEIPNGEAYGVAGGLLVAPVIDAQSFGFQCFE